MYLRQTSVRSQRPGFGVWMDAKYRQTTAATPARCGEARTRPCFQSTTHECLGPFTPVTNCHSHSREMHDGERLWPRSRSRCAARQCANRIQQDGCVQEARNLPRGTPRITHAVPSGKCYSNTSGEIVPFLSRKGPGLISNASSWDRTTFTRTS